jgi:heme exporter protein C
MWRGPQDLWKWLVGLWMTGVVLAAFLYAREAVGFVPGAGRIIFFHVPQAMLAFVGFLLAMIHAVRYLRTRDPIDDLKSETAAELGLLFCALATITGSIFAHVMWNSFWHWDPRETSILILLFIYGAYFGLRMAVEDPERRASLAAVYAILSFVTVPFLMFVVPRIPALNSLHPNQVLWKREGMSIDYKIVFYSSFLGFCGIFTWLFQLQLRVRQIAMRRDEWTLKPASSAGPPTSVSTELTGRP